MLKVQILSHSLKPELTVATAGKLCYSDADLEVLQRGLNSSEVNSFIYLLKDLGHESPLEHAVITFGIEGVSRALTHQLVRHRIASYSQKSQRYVKENQFEYIIPKSIEKNDLAKEIFVKSMEEDQKHYDELVALLINDGCKEKEAIEDARYILPNACETKIILTMNVRSLLNFFRQRTCLRAQREIRELAEEMLKQSKAFFPTLFEDCGPSCLHGPCPEGKLTCGKIKTVREKYNQRDL